MCGRATLTCPVEEIAEHFGVEPIELGPPRFNVAPGQPVLIVRPSSPEHGAATRRELALVRWGLPSASSSSASRGPARGRANRPLIQARAETADTTRAFRDAFRAGRCLIVVDGFYEWDHTGARQPHLVRKTEGGPFALAGLWERDAAAGDAACAVLTTKAQGTIRDLHDRMPFVLAPDTYDAWLEGSAEDARRLITEAPGYESIRARELSTSPVSTWVNDVRHDDPRCAAPAPKELPRQTTLRFT